MFETNKGCGWGGHGGTRGDTAVGGGGGVGADPGRFSFLNRNDWDGFQGSDVFMSWHNAAFCD